MSEIQKATQGSLAKNKKLNQVIQLVNTIGFNLTVREGEGDETPQLIVADNNATLIVSAGGSSSGGGLPDYPGDAPEDDTEIGVLVWDTTDNYGKWLTGYKEKDGLICTNGIVIAGKILFKEDP